MITKESELGTIKRLITEVYPTGPVSIVCDTWDFWKVITEYLPKLYHEIMSRDGTVIVRPDSGDPADIICGNERDAVSLPEHRGAVQCLYETFGGTINEKGYKQLDTHIGLIYGDSTTIERCRDICSRLAYKGYASTNVVFGIDTDTLREQR